jgi:hypothetical protein
MGSGCRLSEEVQEVYFASGKDINLEMLMEDEIKLIK